MRRFAAQRLTPTAATLRCCVQKGQTHTLTKDDMRVAHIVFNRWDTSNKKSLDKKQLGACMDSLKVYLDDDQLEALFMKMDIDSNGRIDFLEFTDHAFAPMPRLTLSCFPCLVFGRLLNLRLTQTCHSGNRHCRP
jgi:hypothetical protein